MSSLWCKKVLQESPYKVKTFSKEYRLITIVLIIAMCIYEKRAVAKAAALFLNLCMEFINVQAESIQILMNRRF